MFEDIIHTYLPGIQEPSEQASYYSEETVNLKKVPIKYSPGSESQVRCPGFNNDLVRFFFFFFFFFFNSVLRPFQHYISSYETGQSVGGAKTGEPREKRPGTPASRTWLVSHVAITGHEPTPDTAAR